MPIKIFLGIAIFLTSLVFTLSLKAQDSYNLHAPRKETRRTLIKIQISDLSIVDTFRIALYTHAFDRQNPDEIKTCGKNTNGYFQFDLSGINHPFYISIFKEYNSSQLPEYMFEQYLVEPGDNVTVSITRDSNCFRRRFPSWSNYIANYCFSFSGTGSQKYQCRYEVDMVSDTLNRSTDVLDEKGEFEVNSHCEASKLMSRQILNKYRGLISGTAYDILKIDFFSTYELERIHWLRHSDFNYTRDSLMAKRFLKLYEEKINGDKNTLSANAFLFSARYWEFESEKMVFEKDILKDIILPYQRIKQSYSDLLRDKIITGFILRSFKSNLTAREVIDDAMRIVKDKFYRSRLTTYVTSNSPGKPAYNFSLMDASNKVVTLKDFKGKVVVIDFWFVGCMSCIHFYKNILSKTEEYFRGNPNICFLTVSIDTDKNIWLQAIDKGNYTSQHVINLYTGGRGQNHPVIKAFDVIEFPRLIIIDKEGKIFNNSYSELKRSTDRLIELISKAAQ